MMLTGHRATITIILAAIAIRCLWSLDANPLLFVYDAYVTIALAQRSIPNHRRVFQPGSTSIAGKTVWITGASSGIGAELSIELASAGVGHLILSGRRREKLEAVAQSCRGVQETRVSVVPFDVSAGSDVLDAAVSSALNAATASGIDILILNAGQYQLSLALDTNLDVALPDIMQVNFASPVQLSKKLIEQDKWKERKHGHLVVISSLMGRGAVSLNAIYSASKHSLRGYFHSLAAEESQWLRIDLVLPGATDTNLWGGSWNTALDKQTDTKNASADDRSKMPVGRCVQLIVSSMLGWNAFFFETWISRNPGLVWVYLASYEPMTFHLATRMIAPFRVGMWRKNGEDALYLPNMFWFGWECVTDYFSGRSDVLFP